MRHSGFTLLLAGHAYAFPQVMEMLARRDTPLDNTCTVNAACNAYYGVSDAEIPYNSNAPTPAQEASAARQNCGDVTPCTLFNAEEQLVSVTGEYAYASPAANQLRGPCPGLNAAANHGYLPRSGYATVEQTIEGLGAAYGMSELLAGFLAAYAVVFDGDIVAGTWSIGGPQPSVLGGLLGAGQGISYSHNKYEGDASIGRCDAYVNDGDAHSLSITRFNYAFSEGLDDDRYTLDKFSRAFAKNTIRSEATNPYYFAPLFSTTLVSPAAYNFVAAFMSNHTAEVPGGYLNGDIFKSFFAVSGEYPNFVWNKGQERIPENWYRRPSVQPYTVPAVFGDLASEFLAYPTTFRLGGNTNGVNTFTGVDLGNITGGVFTADNLFNANNLGCFLYQNIQQGIPDFLGVATLTTDALNFLKPYADKAFAGFECPEISQYNDNNLPPFTGRTYSPDPPANAPENC